MRSLAMGRLSGHDLVTMPNPLVDRPRGPAMSVVDASMVLCQTPRHSISGRPPADVLCAARTRRRVADAAEADLFRLAVDWAVMHPAESMPRARPTGSGGSGRPDLRDGRPGRADGRGVLPSRSSRPAVGLSTEAGKRYLGEALELRYRLPRLWRAGAER